LVCQTFKSYHGFALVGGYSVSGRIRGLWNEPNFQFKRVYKKLGKQACPAVSPCVASGIALGFALHCLLQIV
jgi:hypothetical protein